MGLMLVVKILGLYRPIELLIQPDNVCIRSVLLYEFPEPPKHKTIFSDMLAIKVRLKQIVVEKDLRPHTK